MDQSKTNWEQGPLLSIWTRLNQSSRSKITAYLRFHEDVGSGGWRDVCAFYTDIPIHLYISNSISEYTGREARGKSELKRVKMALGNKALTA